MATAGNKIVRVPYEEIKHFVFFLFGMYYWDDPDQDTIHDRYQYFWRFTNEYYKADVYYNENIKKALYDITGKKSKFLLSLHISRKKGKPTSFKGVD